MSELGQGLIVVVIAILVVVLLKDLLSNATSSKKNGALYSSKPLLSDWERKSLEELRVAVPNDWHICPQVRVADLLTINTKSYSERLSALNRVAKYSVDFVILDPHRNAICVIELDDYSHKESKRRARDATVNRALDEAGIRLVRVRPAKRHDWSKILRDALGYDPLQPNIASTDLALNAIRNAPLSAGTQLVYLHSKD
ncbi:DUF2726 domain-containing protein [Azospirillum sp. SYSU D00513]|uniref:DUF2726 domain-containing protein n=1 Tax=Azospirillum sp. SYSU D00513 TaxID=2812561 RepID=UPI001A9759A8|nr:DUF2726 domain-containing protein [Azospirillum sp. SYSU D00513]